MLNGCCGTHVHAGTTRSGRTTGGAAVHADWLAPYAERWAFKPVRPGGDAAAYSMSCPRHPQRPISIRTFTPDELAAIPHRSSRLQRAVADERRRNSPGGAISAYVTVATVDSEIVGYQLSTLYFDGAHLARLAVLPEHAGARRRANVGDRPAATLCAARYLHRTVNTQLTNCPSLATLSPLRVRAHGLRLPGMDARL